MFPVGVLDGVGIGDHDGWAAGFCSGAHGMVGAGLGATTSGFHCPFSRAMTCGACEGDVSVTTVVDVTNTVVVMGLPAARLSRTKNVRIAMCILKTTPILEFLED